MIKDPNLNTSQAIEKIESEIEMVPEIRYLVDFIKVSKQSFQVFSVLYIYLEAL